MFKLKSSFVPKGDQPKAIDELVDGLSADLRTQVLLGVTGSGKTFTIANVIQTAQRPTLVMAHNKTLAAQLYEEMKGFFPENAVEYFVSYYDYYQPEAYMPVSDTYIAKEALINDAIDRMRHSATRSLLERQDVIIIASVSCIYGIGSVESYSNMKFDIAINQKVDREKIISNLTALQYKRNDIAFTRGTFRIKGEVIDIFPSHLESAYWRIRLFDDTLEKITEIDSTTNTSLCKLDAVSIYPNSHYATPGHTIRQAIKMIRHDLFVRLHELEEQKKLLERQRLEERTMFDLEMLETTGSCNGIENYSRYLTGRASGEPPPTLFEYLPSNALLVIDESHVSVPQIRAMYNGDQARKISLSEYGFRLPSCKDNRPLSFDEWNLMRPQTICVSATPGTWEIAESNGVVTEQLLRPTGLLDPVCIVRPTEGQIDDLMTECSLCIKYNMRTLITTLTKKMAESLSKFLMDKGFKVCYIHADTDTLERIQIIQDLRRGQIDILVGINLLREGLDIPECGLVIIMDADKEGFLRSETSMIQTIGRAARNVNSKVILYADNITMSMKKALDETSRRREAQDLHNKQNNITPSSVERCIRSMEVQEKEHPSLHEDMNVSEMKKKMQAFADNLQFEAAAALRDAIKSRKKIKSKKIK